MDIFLKAFTVFVINTVLLAEGGNLSGFYIQPEEIDEIEYSSVSYKCILTRDMFALGAWLTKTESESKTICMYNNTCNNELNNFQNGSFNCLCENTKEDTFSVELKILNTTYKNHNSTWICEATASNNIFAKKALLFVKVPVKTINIMPTTTYLQVSENSSYEFSCISSLSRPIPKIKWIVAKQNGDKNEFIFAGNQVGLNETFERNLEFANSTFLYRPNRAVNGWILLCVVEKSDIQSEIRSDSILLNITYPPETKLMINGLITDGIYKVIEYNNGSLNCSIKGGNPQPMLSWTKCFKTEHDNIIYTNVSTETFSDVLKWTAEANTDTTCTCQCTQKEQNQTLSINVEILYPPRRPTITFDNYTLKGNISVFINTLLSLNCFSESKPPSKYQWKFNNVGISDKKQYIVHSEISDMGQYTCAANNIMDPTDEKERTVSKTTNFNLEVLYPPTVGTMEYQNILEGTGFNFTCPSIPGNPSTTYIEWTPIINGGVQSLTKFLVIKNVSRNHDMEYNCTVSNTMSPTFQPEKQGRNSKGFHLIVEYFATITAFYVDGFQLQNNITVKENDDLIFLCQVESKPVSTTSIQFQKGYTLKISESNNISYNLRSATCRHNGEYVCSGRNKHNEHSSSRKIFVFVNCSPRIDPDFPVKQNITVSRNNYAFLNFTALAHPTPTYILWQRHNGHIWVNLTSSNNIEMHQSVLNFSLRTLYIGKENLGMYRLTIANEIGSHEQIFFINAEEIYEGENNNDTGIMLAIVLSVVGVIGVGMAISFLIWILKRRRGGKKTDSTNHQHLSKLGNRIGMKIIRLSKKDKTKSEKHGLPVEMEHLQEIDDVPDEHTERTEYYNSIDKIEQIDKIKVSELCQYVIGRDEDEFALEFQNLSTQFQKPYCCALKPENIALNRYNGIFPYDHSRVKISGIPDFYMNACYIDGFDKRKTYIASLGPTVKTTNSFITFWQMVWFERSDVIVMLTNLWERSEMKCEQYWPEYGEKAYFGEICVSSIRSDSFAEYTVREFQLSNNGEKRYLTQLHYTAWPDKTVPEDVTSLIEFRQRMILTPTNLTGPIIVHCSAGIGRTGTLIALDRLIKEGQKTHELNVFECVQSMREQRVRMVQTLEQYIFIYNALVSALTFDCEAISLSSFPNCTRETKNNTYSRQFQQLKQSVEKTKESEQDACKQNGNLTNKNRRSADIPGDRFRVHLRLKRKHEGTDYINAVFVNSFVKADFFIMAQTPLPSTVEDFVCLIYQEDCTCIVSLDDSSIFDTSFGTYVPEGKLKLRTGNFKASSSLLETKRDYVLRKLHISYNGRSCEKSVKHFQYTNWLEEKQVPECAEDFVQFVCDVQQYATKRNDEGSHILVHCLKANERSGLFCALSIIFEKLKYEQQVSMLNTLRHLRTRRPTAITSLEQLRFCYKAASIYAGLERH